MPTLAQVYLGLTGHALSGGGEARVGPWVMNSLLVQPGGGFVARPGAGAASPDGHSFIADAFQRGAAVVIADRDRTETRLLPPRVRVVDLSEPPVETVVPPVLFLADSSLYAIQKLATWWRNQANPGLKVIGITGSVGKTTVKELVSVVLSQRFRTWKSRGNYNSDIGVPLTLLDMPLDVERAVIELGMTRAGEIEELCAIVRPEVGVVTNVGPVHMEQLGSIEAIANAKSELVRNLPAHGLAILNGDDPRVRAMDASTPARVLTYGLQPEFSLWADEIESHGLNGIAFRFHYDGDTVFARLPLLGRHSVHAALAAAAVGLSQGQSWGEIIGGLKDLAEMEVLRIVVAPGINGSTLIDDTYNASPDSVLAALNLLEDLDGRRVAVLGDMLELGAYAEEGHKRVARRVANVASLFAAIGKMSARMVKEARIAGLPPESTVAATERQEALEWLRDRLRPGDIVLVKGSRGLRLDKLVAELTVGEADR
jgi:UDP-N-acetylmuramoyl-tripeptide--D-alanyl-D-alanine ligase